MKLNSCYRNKCYYYYYYYYWVPYLLFATICDCSPLFAIQDYWLFGTFRHSQLFPIQVFQTPFIDDLIELEQERHSSLFLHYASCILVDE